LFVSMHAATLVLRNGRQWRVVEKSTIKLEEIK